MVRHFWFPRANFLIPRENVLPRFARKNNFLPRNQKVCPRESKVCLTIFLPLASIFPCDRNNYSHGLDEAVYIGLSSKRSQQLCWLQFIKSLKSFFERVPPPGIEPRPVWLQDRCSNHCSILAGWKKMHNVDLFMWSTRRVSEAKPRAAAAARSFAAWATLRYAQAEKERAAAARGLPSLTRRVLGNLQEACVLGSKPTRTSQLSALFSRSAR